MNLENRFVTQYCKVSTSARIVALASHQAAKLPKQSKKTCSNSRNQHLLNEAEYDLVKNYVYRGEC